MDSQNQSAPPSAETHENVYRCSRCGVESNEPSCFLSETDKASPLIRTCITCGQPAPMTSRSRTVFGIFGVLLLPLLIALLAFKDKSPLIFPRLLLAACVIQPLVLILHEFGHVLTARLLGLEVNRVTLGVGPTIWAVKIMRTPIRIHGWPLSGRTSLGSRSMRFLRLRVWLTTLMGPGTNFLLIAAAVIFWDPLARVFGASIVFLWMIFNWLYLVGNLFPYRSRRSGVLLGSDGLQLLQMPFRKSAELLVVLSTTALIGAMELFEAQDYEGARRACFQGLERMPRDPLLCIILSACHINLGDYESGRALLEPLIDSSPALLPDLRAAIENNLGIALWLRDFNTDQRHESATRADALLDYSYKTFPCILTYRTSRALILAATDRPEDALTLLEYVNYATGSQEDRANHQIARAFALRRLNRKAEADQALAAGLRLTRKRLPWLSTIGLIPAATG